MQLSFSKFYSDYLSLSITKQKILFELLRKLEHVKPHNRLKDTSVMKRNIRENIQRYRKERGYTLDQLCEIVTEEDRDNQLDFDTLYSIIKRNSQNSKFNKKIAKALGIEERELYYGEKIPQEILENLLIMSCDACDMKWLFESLSECNQKAILYLAKALLMSENHPEVFEDIENYSE